MCEQCQELKSARDAALERMRQAMADYSAAAPEQMTQLHSEFSAAVERARATAYAVNEHWLGRHSDRAKLMAAAPQPSA